MAVMKKEFVEKLEWFNDDEMMDLISIGQSTPGAIAINTSVLVGYKVCGIVGALVTVLGTITPPVLIMSLVSLGYDFIKDNYYVMVAVKGMQAGVAALLVDASINMFVNVTKEKHWYSFVLIGLAFVYAKFFNFGVLYLAILCALLGVLKVVIVGKKVNSNDAN